MDANDVNMVAVGLEQLGAEEFVEAKFFEGGIIMVAGHSVRLFFSFCDHHYGYTVEPL